MRKSAALFAGLLVIAFARGASARADAHKCRSFADQVLTSLQEKKLDELSAGGGSWDLHGLGDDSDAPFINVTPNGPDKKNHPKFFTASDAHSGWLLDLNIGPSRHYVYHFQVRDHACILQMIDVNSYRPMTAPIDCAKAKAGTDQVQRVFDACRIGQSYFDSKAPVVTGSGVTPPPGGAGNAAPH